MTPLPESLVPCVGFRQEFQCYSLAGGAAQSSIFCRLVSRPRYLGACDRFYLDQWRTSVEQRLAQLDKLYSVVHAEVNEQRMLWLEIIIVIFFALDLMILLWVRR